MAMSNVTEGQSEDDLITDVSPSTDINKLMYLVQVYESLLPRNYEKCKPKPAEVKTASTTPLKHKNN